MSFTLRRALFLLVLAVCFHGSASAAPIVFSAAGATAGSILPVVASFQASLGTLNPNVAGSFGTGRREINWDGVPDASAAPNNLPANFFNVNSPRGVVFSTPGTGFQVSANAVNPTSTPINFGNINAAYVTTFAPFSPQRLFTSLGSNITDVNFFVPGSNTPALVRGFGAVFSDVDLANATSIEYFDAANASLGTFIVPAVTGGANATFSFLGVAFSQGNVVSRVRITSGNAVLGPAAFDVPGTDLVVMDDFIYGEPVAAASVIPLPPSAWAGLMGAIPVVLAWRRWR